MTLALAIKQHASTFVAAQKKYKESVIAVNMQMIAVSTAKLPAMPVVPSDWAQYQTTYVQAQGAALDWANTVLARLLGVPKEVRDYNDGIVAIFNDAITQAGKLVRNPNDTAALAALQNDLGALPGQVKLVKGFIAGAITNIQSFQNNLPNLSGQLQHIADMATNDVGVDKAKVTEMNKNIARLQADINFQIGAIVALGIVDVAAISLGVFSTIAFWPFGLLAWLPMGLVIGIATYYIALDAIQIQKDQAEMDGYKNQVDGLNAAICVLKLLSDTFAGLATKTVGIKDDLQAVLNAWQAFETSINGAIGEIQKAVNDEKSRNFSTVVTELNQALTEWNGVYQQAGTLFIKLDMKQGLDLKVGMTKEQIKAASDSAPSIDIIDYYNQQAA